MIKTPKLLFNEIFTPNFEKNKFVQAHERLTIQLMSVLRNDEKDINNFKCTSKTHSTLDDKKFGTYSFYSNRGRVLSYGYSPAFYA